MKNGRKWMAGLAAALLAFCCVWAAAEDAAVTADDGAVALFDSAWAGDRGEISLYYMDGYWKAEVTSFNSTEMWDYICVYDAEQNALISDDGSENVKTVVTLDEEGSEVDRAAVYTDGKASFFLNPAGNLIWNDEKEHAGAETEYVKIGWFNGAYACMNYTLNCFWDTEVTEEGEVFSGYKLEIEAQDENGAVTFWLYAGEYDPEGNVLTAYIGTKEFQEKEGEAIRTLWDDGKAVFTLDEEGNLLWKDEKENAGEGLVFVRTNG